MTLNRYQVSATMVLVLLSTSFLPLMANVAPVVHAQSMTMMTPNDIRSAYDVTPLLQNGYTGKGVTVAIVNTGIDSSFYSDVVGFDSYYGLPAVNISAVTPYGTS